VPLLPWTQLSGSAAARVCCARQPVQCPGTSRSGASSVSAWTVGPMLGVKKAPPRCRPPSCGNDDRGQPESSCRPGPDGGIRTAALHRLAGMVTASRCCPEVPAPQPQPPRTSPDDLAAELNPHKTELNPHKAVEAASRARTDQTGLPSSGQSPPARQLAKAELSRRPRSAVPMMTSFRRRARSSVWASTTPAT
jgi:hypothetical protein